MNRRRNMYGVDGKPLEWVIQDAILQSLMWAGKSQPIKFWRARPSQYIREQGSNVGFNLHPSEIGMPDIMGAAYGFFIGMEVKRPRKKLTTDQEIWRDDFLRADRTRYAIVHSVDEALEVINQCHDVEKFSEIGERDARH